MRRRQPQLVLSLALFITRTLRSLSLSFSLERAQPDAFETGARDLHGFGRRRLVLHSARAPSRALLLLELRRLGRPRHILLQQIIKFSPL